jgi:hypothetical protein
MKNIPRVKVTDEAKKVIAFFSGGVKIMTGENYVEYC